MGYVKLAFFVALGAFGFSIFRTVSNIFEVPPVPKLEEIWWGPNPNGKQDTEIIPFKINIPDEVLKDLRYRLKITKPLPSPLEASKQSYGINSQVTTKIVDHWLNKYDWREREKLLNRYPQFKTDIQGLKIHFLHVKPKEHVGLKVLPLLLIHGWPGSVVEFYDIIPYLTTPQKGRNFVFEVVAPSLPGYGFSDAAVRPGLGPTHMALILKNLMKRLKMEKFYVQGGDWGAILASHMSTLFAENIIGMHSNMCSNMSPKSILKRMLYSFQPSLIVDKKYEHLVFPFSTVFSKTLEETGYMHLQATKPDTIGTALTDSPAGLAAYIIEKFITWTNPNWKHTDASKLTEAYKIDSLIDNIMVYWVTGSITTSMRLYAEAFNKAEMSLNLDRIPVQVPAGCSRFIHDLVYSPTALLEDKYPNLIHVTDHEGGHFAALELPHILAKDVYDFTEKVLRLQSK
ncbi:hypothetical protein WA026_020935 [Henosepilachna vigintioctopunctata]|uniref:Epoxide hydrolase n=1 Tax=Henosepilachna vigintioctopunctata TaxID=420089 RepID=A0AAW1UIA1_9CUCU